MKKLLLLITITLLLSSCCRKTIGITKTVTIRDTTTITVKERVIDTFIQADTVTNTIQLECDSNNRVRIKRGTNNQGNRTNQTHSLDDNGKLSIQSICNELRIQLLAKDSIIERLKETTIDTKEVVVEKRGFWENITFYVKHLIFIVISIVIGVIISKFIKF